MLPVSYGLHFFKLFKYSYRSAYALRLKFSTENGHKIQEYINKQQRLPSTFTKNVKETTKNVYYTSIVIIGFGITGVIFYMIGKELFSSNTPTAQFSKALKIIKSHVEISDILGSPLRAFGEDTGRGRRKHIRHEIFTDSKGDQYMRLKFYIAGADTLKRGTVFAESKYDPLTKHCEFSQIVVRIGGGFSERVIKIL